MKPCGFTAIATNKAPTTRAIRFMDHAITAEQLRPQQLDHYLDEFVFRFNRRTSRSRGLLFYRLLEQAILTEPLTYSQIAGGSKHKI